MVNALTVYPNRITASTTLSTANQLIANATISGSTNANTVLLGTATGFGELWAQGNTGAWAAGSVNTAIAPTAHGWFLDSTILDGKSILAGNWTTSLRFKTSANTCTITAYARFYQYRSGVYTQLGVTSRTGVALTTTSTTFAFSAVSFPQADFVAGDKLYMDVWADVTASTMVAGNTIDVVQSNVANDGATSINTITPGFATTKDLYGTGRTRVSIQTSSNGVGRIGVAVTQARSSMGRMLVQAGGTSSVRKGMGRVRAAVQTVRKTTGRVRLAVTHTGSGLGRMRAGVQAVRKGMGRAGVVATRIRSGTGRVLTSLAQKRTGVGRARAAIQTIRSGGGRVRATATAVRAGMGRVRYAVQLRRAAVGRARLAAQTIRKGSGRARLLATRIRNAMGRVRAGVRTPKSAAGRIALVALQTYGTDTFLTGSRGTPNAWSPASDGQNWVQQAGASALSIVNINGQNRGNISGDALANILYLGTRQFTDVDIYCRVSVSNTAVRVGIIGRSTSSSIFYRADVTGTTFELFMDNGGAGSVIASTPVTFAANTYYLMHLRMHGFGFSNVSPNNITANFWADPNSGVGPVTAGEPSGWMVSATDTTVIGNGNFGVYYKAALAAQSATVDSFVVTDCPPWSTVPYNTTGHTMLGHSIYEGTNTVPFPTQGIIDLVGPNTVSATGLGAGVTLRYQKKWADVEPYSDLYDWALLDDAVQKANYYGFNILWPIQMPPPFHLTRDAMGSAMTLTAARTSGIGYTTLAVTALPDGAYVPHGYQITVDWGTANAETVYVWNPAATYTGGATTIGISTSKTSQIAWTPANTHAIGAVVWEALSGGTGGPQYGGPSEYATIFALAAARYNGSSGFGKLDYAQVENEDYDATNRVGAQGAYNVGAASPSSWDMSSTWDNGGAILAPVYKAACDAFHAVPGMSSVPVFSCSVRKPNATARQHIINWVTGFVTKVLAAGGVVDGIDFHYYRDNSLEWDGTLVQDPTISTHTDSSLSVINAPSVAMEASDILSTCAGLGASPLLMCGETGWALYDDGNGTSTPTTTSYASGTGPYTSLAVSATWANGKNIPNATPISINYTNPANTETVYAYGQAIKFATTIQITTNPLGNGAAQAGWTPAHTQASGVTVYGITGNATVTPAAQAQYVLSMHNALRAAGAYFSFVYTIEPSTNTVHSTVSPAWSDRPDSITQTIAGTYTYEPAYIALAATEKGRNAAGRMKVSANAITVRKGMGRLRVSAKRVATGMARLRLSIASLRTALGRTRLAAALTRIGMGRALISVKHNLTLSGRTLLAIPHIRTGVGRVALKATAVKSTVGRVLVSTGTGMVRKGVGRLLLKATALRTAVGRIRVHVSALRVGMGRLLLKATTLRSGIGRLKLSTGAITVRSGVGRLLFKATALRTALGRLRFGVASIRKGMARVAVSVVLARKAAGRVALRVGTHASALARARVTALAGRQGHGRSGVVVRTHSAASGRGRVAIRVLRTGVGRVGVVSTVQHVRFGMGRVLVKLAGMFVAANIQGRVRLVVRHAQMGAGRVRVQIIYADTVFLVPPASSVYGISAGTEAMQIAYTSTGWMIADNDTTCDLAPNTNVWALQP